MTIAALSSALVALAVRAVISGLTVVGGVTAGVVAVLLIVAAALWRYGRQVDPRLKSVRRRDARGMRSVRGDRTHGA